MILKDITNSFITMQELKESNSGSLNGMTFGIKDCIPVKGMRCTYGSRIFHDKIADQHSRVVQTILFNGGTIVGKTNLHEFAIGATNTSSLIGPCRNPHDMERICGGSSGGSAAAVASGLVDVGVGTDTGGSIRIPASLCGVVGYKPSNMYAKSDSDLPFSEIMEATGIITRNFTTLLWTIRELFPNIEEMDWDSDEIKLGILATRSDANFDAFIESIKSSNSNISAEPANIPLLQESGNSVRRTISSRDGYNGHKDILKEHFCDYSPDVRTILENGGKVEKSDYDSAISLRKEIISQYNEAMYDFDAIICPTTEITAPKVMDVIGKEAEFREPLVRNVELFNVLGSPSITVPSGFIDGLPTGLLISGGPGDDTKTLKIAERVSKLLTSKKVK